MNLNNILESLNLGNKHLISLNGLEFISKNITKGSCIEIYGDENTAKTLFAKNLVANNPNKIFLYMDTYCKLNIDKDNTILLRSNKIEDLFNLLEHKYSADIDVIIIDAISYVYMIEDEGNTLRYESYLKMVKNLIDICFKKKIVLILLNTTNGAGNAYCSTYQLRHLINTIVKFEKTDIKLNETETITSIIEKNKMGSRTNHLLYIKRDY